MLGWLRGAIVRQKTAPSLETPPAPVGTYPIYTTEFDRVITVEQWRNDLGREGGARHAMLDRAVSLVENSASEQIHDIAIATAADYSRVNRSLPVDERTDTVVSVLIDHSGSLRGVPQVVMFAAVNAIVRLLDHLRIPYEVLGFTTSSWRGGQSRYKWLTHGKPEYPGRLCDLLHIVYSDVNDWPLRGHIDLPLLCYRGALKENVDGEAVLWACQRLRALPHTRKLLFVMSDGAPVDESTLEANWNSILHDHIIAVVRKTESQGDILVSGIGLAHDVRAYYSSGSTFHTIDEVGEKVVRFFADRLCASASFPDSTPAPDMRSGF